MTEAAINFFKLYIGDYQRDTGALTLAEHGAYMLMLQHYYATEKPLPTGRELHRLLRAETKAERDAIDAISGRFWSEKDGSLINLRADEEIAKGRAQAETNRAIAKQREERKRATKAPRTVHESLHDKNRGSGKKGGNFSKNPKNFEECDDTETVDACIPKNAQVFEKKRNTEHESCNESSNESCTNREPNHSHSHIRHSEANASGVPPSPEPVADPPSAAIPIDPTKAVFDLGVSLLTATGHSDKAARSLVAKLRKALDDDGAMQVLVAAKSKTDPASYIAAAMTPDPVAQQIREAMGGSRVEKLPDGRYRCGGSYFNADGSKRVALC